MPPSVRIVRERQSAKRIALFSHKGGVGKTTLTVNIAFALAALKKRVLLVDTDPQCNLSAYLLDSSALDGLLDNSDSPYGKTLLSMLHDVEGRGASEEGLIPALETASSMRLVPGDIKLSEFEEELAYYWRAAKQRDLESFSQITAISLVVNSLCAAEKIDFVFYDCGPNIGPLNRCVLLDCDYFLVPAACDEFSIRAVGTLGATLSRWLAEWEDVVDLAPDGTYLPQGKPQFLGYILQQFKVYRGEVTSGYSQFISRIDRRVQEDIVAVLRKTHPDAVRIAESANLKFGEVRDLTSLVAGGQNVGLPIWEVSDGSADLKSEAKNMFFDMARKLIALGGVDNA
jgi:cellulose biosynthesis protein BcsQ